jgi:hypothetical protein
LVGWLVGCLLACFVGWLVGWLVMLVLYLTTGYYFPSTPCFRNPSIMPHFRCLFHTVFCTTHDHPCLMALGCIELMRPSRWQSYQWQKRELTFKNYVDVLQKHVGQVCRPEQQLLGGGAQNRVRKYH